MSMIDITPKARSLSPFDDWDIETEIKNALDQMLDSTKSLMVSDEASYKDITFLYSKAKEWEKIIEAKRVELVAPFRKKIAAINDKAQEISIKIDEILSLTKVKTASYLKLVEENKKKEDEKLKALAQSLFDSDEDIYIPELPKSFRGDGAMASIRTEKRFTVEDISKVPLKYLKVDEKLVKQDIKLGIIEIPGINIYEEKITQLRIR